MSDRDFYEQIIDLASYWQQIVEDGSPGDAPDEAIALLAGVVRKIVTVAEETNPGGYHTEVFNIVHH